MLSQNVFAVWYVNIDSLLGAAQHETAHISHHERENTASCSGFDYTTTSACDWHTKTQRTWQTGSCHVVCRMPGTCDVICGTTCGERERIKQCILMLSPVGLNSYNELAWVGCREFNSNRHIHETYFKWHASRRFTDLLSPILGKNYTSLSRGLSLLTSTS